MGGTYMRPLKYRCPLSKCQSEKEERENNGDPLCKAERMRSMRGLEEVELAMDWESARSRALMTIGSGTMEEA